MARDNFSEKLQLLLKVMVMSRTGLAAALNVDKSLVSRWVSGTVNPSEHNLALLTRYVANSIPGFTVLDWERDLPGFAQHIGAGDAAPVASMPAWVPDDIAEESKRNAERRGNQYAGLWRSTRASNDMPGRFIHDIVLVGVSDDGSMRFKCGVEGVRYEGWALLLQHQVFSCSFDREAGTAMFSIFNGVARQKPQMLDGMNLATLRDAGGSPAASASVLERLADPTGDPNKDDEMFEKAISELSPLALEGSISDEIAEHLTKSVHGDAAGILRLLFSQSLARGATLSELAGRP
ncbi:MAG: helix-turn-helix transcriptional regulator [Parvularculaceae bacterium]|nr:helix-turn-helix transcriptional regulator [Parvularculaceae bacterium]